MSVSMHWTFQCLRVYYCKIFIRRTMCAWFADCNHDSAAECNYGADRQAESNGHSRDCRDCSGDSGTGLLFCLFSHKENEHGDAITTRANSPAGGETSSRTVEQLQKSVFG